MEPLLVSFELTDPLGVPIRATVMQLVARMKCGETSCSCTNEGAVEIDCLSPVLLTIPWPGPWAVFRL
jgi:hypothetical protein